MDSQGKRDHKNDKKGKKSKKQNRYGQIKIIKDETAKKSFKEALEQHNYNGLDSLHDEYIQIFRQSDSYIIKKQLNNQSIGNMIMKETKDEIYILLLYINQQHRRNGFGTDAIEYLKKKGKIIKIHCDAQDMNTIDFWLNNGFQRNQQDDLHRDAGYMFDPTS